MDRHGESQATREAPREGQATRDDVCRSIVHESTLGLV